ncbi:MAG: DUF1792 domain-containing protein [Bacteroides sp.]|nr:DUF1792 domain-containing protein [Bacteroides sp.]
MLFSITKKIVLGSIYIINKLLYNLRYHKRNQIKILTFHDTINKAITESKSICRYGDGELNMIINNKLGYDSSRKSGFQSYDPSLGLRLKEILISAENQSDCIVCLPGCMFGVGTKYLNRAAGSFWERYSNKNSKHVYDLISTQITYGDTNFTRFYLSHKDKSNCRENLENIKLLWRNRNLLIVEGEKTRLGHGNDLFDNAKTISRILCPATNAWGKYTDILNKTIEIANGMEINGEKPLIIIALGMTATILAYDLSQKGLQAIDLGHLDIEYEWMLMGATKKIPIKGKFTNESKDGGIVSDNVSQIYKSQIVGRIC